MVILYLSVSKSDHSMKKGLVLVAIAALLVCIIPMADSSDAAGETTISGYLSVTDRDISTASSIEISIIYSDDDGATGEIIGTTNTVSPKTITLNANKFTVPIEPKADRTITNYYIYFNIYGYSVIATPTGFIKTVNPIDVDGMKYSCYKMNGADIIDGDNPIGDASSGWFTLKVAEGTVTGKVSTNATEPVYLNGVTVKLYDIDKKNELKSTTTGNGGEYSMDYSTGEYVITFEIGGYQTEEVKVVITEGTPTVCNVTMKETQSYFGLDLPHALMIIGGSLAVVLLLFTLFMRTRLSKR